MTPLNVLTLLTDYSWFELPRTINPHCCCGALGRYIVPILSCTLLLPAEVLSPNFTADAIHGY